MTDFTLRPTEPIGARKGKDHYPTPRSAVVALVRYAERLRLWQRGETVLDPCAGEGALLDVLAEVGLVTRGVELTERARVAAERHRVTQGDGLIELAQNPCPLVVMNPPYSIGYDFVRQAVEHRPARGLVCSLMRLSWLEPTDERRVFLVENKPTVLILPQRPDFLRNGKADNITSAWFVWPALPELYDYLSNESET